VRQGVVGAAIKKNAFLGFLPTRKKLNTWMMVAISVLRRYEEKE